jgi:hypothetical protein
MNVGALLLAVGFLLFVTYCLLFQMILRRAGAEAARHYSQEVARPRFNLVGIGLLGGALLVPMTMVAGLLALSAVAWIVLGTFRQRRAMRALQFEKSFVDNLFGASFVVATAVGCLLAGKLWYQAFAV